MRSYLSFALGNNVSLEILTPDLREKIFRLLSRQAELKISYSQIERSTFRKEHLSNEELAHLECPVLDQELIEWRRQLRIPEPKSRWPDGRKFALCITHDMDQVTSFGIAGRWRRLARQMKSGRSRAALIKAGLKTMRATVGAVYREHILKRQDVLSNVHEWMRIEDSLGFKSTFYYLPTTISPWHPFDCDYSFRDKVAYRGKRMKLGKVVQEIAAAGWEIGLHGTYYSATEPGVLRSQKEELEQCLGRSVATTRQHYLQYDLRQTPGLQTAAGFSADSTQGFNDLIGFRAGTSFPYFCWDWENNQVLPLLQIPLHIQDVALLGYGRSETEAVEATFKMMDAVQEVGGCLTILWHPLWLAKDAGLSVFRCILEEARSRGAWGCSANALSNWWRTETNRIMAQPVVG